MKTELFRQKAEVGIDGSFLNQMMGNNSTLPVVGKGATRMSYSDRHCYEVIEVSADGKTVKLEALDAVHDKTKEGGMGHQNWILNPTGRFTTIHWRNNAWRTKHETIEYVPSYYKAFEEREKEVGHKQAKEEMIKPLFNENGDLALVEGKTRIKTSWNKMSILFGTKDYYYDWSF